MTRPAVDGETPGTKAGGGWAYPGLTSIRSRLTEREGCETGGAALVAVDRFLFVAETMARDLKGVKSLAQKKKAPEGPVDGIRGWVKV